MPTTLLGIILYVFSLAPGVAFAFAREGHHPSTRRSAIRETASIISASTLCNAFVLLIGIGVASTSADARQIIKSVLAGDYTWPIENYLLVLLYVVLALVAATLLGWALGGPKADQWFVNRVWKAQIARDASAWSETLDSKRENVIVKVAITLKSGGWLSGAVYTYEADPNPNPERALVLSGEIQYRAPGQTVAAELKQAAFMVVEASEIEILQVSYVEAEVVNTPAPPMESRFSRWARRNLPQSAADHGTGRSSIG